MIHNNLKALEYAKEITVAYMEKFHHIIDVKDGNNVAEFFEIVFNKLVELEDQSYIPKNY